MIKRRPIEMLDKFNQAAGHLAISSVTLAELIHGVEKSQFVSKNLRVVEDFCSRLDILEYDATAAYHYGDIRAQLEKQGSIIGVNDIHIAAHARSLGAVLVTNNLKEFERVEGLRIQNWISNTL